MVSDQGQSLSRAALLRRLAFAVVGSGVVLVLMWYAPGPWFVGWAIGIALWLAARRVYGWAFDDELPERTRSEQIRSGLMLVAILALVIPVLIVARRLTW